MSISIRSEPGIRLATAVASSASMPALSRKCLRFRVDLAAGLVDQPADIDEDVGKAATRSGSDGIREGLFVGQRFAVGGIDHLLERLFVFGDGEEIADHADRGAVVALDLEVDAFVGAVLGGLVAALALLFDEVLGGGGIGGLNRDPVAGEVVAVVALKEEAAPFAQPGLDFLFEVEIARGIGRAFELGDDQAAEVVDAGEALGEGLDVRPQLAFRLHRSIDEEG